MALYEIDDRDRAIIAERQAALLERPEDEPRAGDVVEFADGIVRRVSYVWSDGVQSSDGGSYYLGGSGHMSMSGSLYTTVPTETLTRVDGETREADAWMFHHDMPGAGRGVHFQVQVPVWKCSVNAPMV